MVSIGISQPVILPPLPSLPSQAGQGSQIGLGNNSQPALGVTAVPPDNNGSASNQGAYDPQAAEQGRANTVTAAAQQIANPYVVSDQVFTIFKDVTGQYITRFTSLRDGKVTYIPEPTIYSLGGPSGGNSEPLVQIKA